MRHLALVAAAWLMAGLASPLQAHIASNGFLEAQVSGALVTGTLELHVRDAEMAVGLDADHDGRVTWGEVSRASLGIRSYLASHLRFSSQGAACPLQFGDVQINARVDGNYLWLPFTARCPAAVQRLGVDYRLLDEEDPSHRGLLALRAAGVTQTAVLGAAAGTQVLDLGTPSVWRGFLEYLQAGTWHIWDGVDHLLFLVSLLLPAVLLRRGGRWLAVPMARPAFVNILKVVTAFTIAHSVTLSLAAFDVVHLPSRLTESVIAASIIVGALNNVFPLVTESRWRVAFAFGLLHGFGFAAVLSDMGLPRDSRLVSLFGFNLGVEVGQLAVVAAVMPVAYLLRRTRFYQRGVMPWGSTAIAGLALVWFVQRALG